MEGASKGGLGAVVESSGGEEMSAGVLGFRDFIADVEVFGGLAVKGESVHDPLHVFNGAVSGAVGEGWCRTTAYGGDLPIWR